MTSIHLHCNSRFTSVCKKVRNNKAPGPDGLSNIALKQAIQALPEGYMDLYITCLEERIFFLNWKKQRLVLLPAIIRLLCMLDTLGQILKRLLSNRMKDTIEKKGGLAEHQYSCWTCVYPLRYSLYRPISLQ